MSILSSYIARAYLKLIALCTGAFISIYLVIDLLEKVGKFTRAGGRPKYIIEFFLWKIPEITTQIIPLAVLMATLLTLGTLARSSELTAMRSAGAGLMRISSPILGIALLASIVNLLLAEFVVPKSFEKMRYYENVKIYRQSQATFFRQGNIWFRDGHAIMRAQLFEPATATLHGITSWQVNNAMQPTARIDAVRGVHKGESWQLHDVVQRKYSSGRLLRTVAIAEQPAPIRLSVNDLKVVGKLAENMGFLELRKYCRKLTQGGYDPTRYLTLLHAKLASPFSPLVMGFLGIPFALKGGRSRGPAIGFGLSLVIGLSYFIINAFLISFGQAGALPPIVAAWAANLLFVAVGIWLALTLDH